MSTDDLSAVKEAAQLKEALRYLEKRVDQLVLEVQNLHRENSKQAEEIRDAAYLADSTRNKYEEFKELCREHKSGQCASFDKLHNELDLLYKEEVAPLKAAVGKIAASRLTLVIRAVTTTIIIVTTIIGALTGWITFGG